MRPLICASQHLHSSVSSWAVLHSTTFYITSAAEWLQATAVPQKSIFSIGAAHRQCSLVESLSVGTKVPHFTNSHSVHRWMATFFLTGHLAAVRHFQDLIDRQANKERAALMLTQFRPSTCTGVLRSPSNSPHFHPDRTLDSRVARTTHCKFERPTATLIGSPLISSKKVRQA